MPVACKLRYPLIIWSSFNQNCISKLRNIQCKSSKKLCDKFICCFSDKRSVNQIFLKSKGLLFCISWFIVYGYLSLIFIKNVRLFDVLYHYLTTTTTICNAPLHNKFKVADATFKYSLLQIENEIITVMSN